MRCAVPAGAKFTDTTYSVATTSANGLMSSTDKARLDTIYSDYVKSSDIEMITNAEIDTIMAN